MSAAYTGSPLASYCIYLVYEDYARSIFLGLFKQVSHSGGSYADKHLHKVGTAYCEERHSRFTCGRFGHICLSCSRRANQQYALWYPCSKVLVFSWVFKEINNFFQFLFFLIKAGHIGKCDLLLVAFYHFGSGFGKLESFAVSVLRHHKVYEEYDRSRRKKGRQYAQYD